MQKVWFITGCSKGFGRTLVEELLKRTSDSIIITARELSAIEHFSKKYPDRVLTQQLDVTNEEDISCSIKAGIKKFQRIDVLVNNAGYGLVGALEECSMGAIRRIFETNVFGPMCLIKKLLPYMRLKKSGHIINISSVAGLVAGPGQSLYNSTKFALEGLSEGLYPELASFGIKTTLIEPGPFRTDFADPSSLHTAPPHTEYKDTPADQVRAYVKKINKKQQGDPVKAANIIIEISKMDKPPLRLPLGAIAKDRIEEKFKKQEEEFLQYDSLSRSADFSL